MRLPSEYNARGNCLLTDLEGPAGDALDEMRQCHKMRACDTPRFAGLVDTWMEYVRSLPEDDQISIMLAACKLVPDMLPYGPAFQWTKEFSSKITYIYKAV